MDNTPVPTSQQTESDVLSQTKKPDDLAGLYFEAKIKIIDPESGKVFLEGRA